MHPDLSRELEKPSPNAVLIEHIMLEGVTKKGFFSRTHKPAGILEFRLPDKSETFFHKLAQKGLLSKVLPAFLSNISVIFKNEYPNFKAAMEAKLSSKKQDGSPSEMERRVADLEERLQIAQNTKDCALQSKNLEAHTKEEESTHFAKIISAIEADLKLARNNQISDDEAETHMYNYAQFFLCRKNANGQTAFGIAAQNGDIIDAKTIQKISSQAILGDILDGVSRFVECKTHNINMNRDLLETKNEIVNSEELADIMSKLSAIVLSNRSDVCRVKDLADLLNHIERIFVVIDRFDNEYWNLTREGVAQLLDFGLENGKLGNKYSSDQMNIDDFKKALSEHLSKILTTHIILGNISSLKLGDIFKYDLGEDVSKELNTSYVREVENKKEAYDSDFTTLSGKLVAFILYYECEPSGNPEAPASMPRKNEIAVVPGQATNGPSIIDQAVKNLPSSHQASESQFYIVEFAEAVRAYVSNPSKDRIMYNDLASKKLGDIDAVPPIFYWLAVHSQYSQDIPKVLKAVAKKQKVTISYEKFIKEIVESSDIGQKVKVDKVSSTALQFASMLNSDIWVREIYKKSLKEGVSPTDLEQFKIAIKANSPEAFKAMVEVAQEKMTSLEDQSEFWWGLLKMASKYGSTMIIDSYIASDATVIQKTTDRARKTESGKYNVLNLLLNDFDTMLTNYILVNGLVKNVDSNEGTRCQIATKLNNEGFRVSDDDIEGIKAGVRNYVVGTLIKANNLLKCISSLYKAEKLYIPQETPESASILTKTAQLLRDIGKHKQDMEEANDIEEHIVSLLYKTSQMREIIKTMNQGKCKANSECYNDFKNMAEFGSDAMSERTNLSNLTALSAIIHTNPQDIGSVDMSGELPNMTDWGYEF